MVSYQSLGLSSFQLLVHTFTAITTPIKNYKVCKLLTAHKHNYSDRYCWWLWWWFDLSLQSFNIHYTKTNTEYSHLMVISLILYEYKNHICIYSNIVFDIVSVFTGCCLSNDRLKLEERKQKRILAKRNNCLPVLMCSQCGYKTKEKYQFKVHMNNHNGIKDFKYVIYYYIIC